MDGLPQSGNTIPMADTLESYYLNLAVNYAQSKGFGFSSTTLEYLKKVIEKGAEIIRERQRTENENWEAKGQVALAKFIDTMIDAAEADDGILGARTLHTARGIICPLEPWCE